MYSPCCVTLIQTKTTQFMYCTHSFDTDRCCSVQVQQHTNHPKYCKCPPWFAFSNNSVGVGILTVCALKNFGNIIICDEKLYLQMGYCRTYNSSFSDEQESNATSFGACPHVYYSTIINHGLIHSSTT